MQENTNPKTWKDWVDWWPTYLIIGIALAHLVNKTEIVSKLKTKIFAEKKAD